MKISSGNKGNLKNLPYEIKESSLYKRQDIEKLLNNSQKIVVIKISNKNKKEKVELTKQASFHKASKSERIKIGKTNNEYTIKS